MLDKETIEKRLNVCTECEYLKQTILGGKCLKCGCLLKFKAGLKSQDCPIGKW